MTKSLETLHRELVGRVSPGSGECSYCGAHFPGMTHREGCPAFGYQAGPPTFQHALLHLVRYVGEAATIAERLDHAREDPAGSDAARARAEALAFLERREAHFQESTAALFKHLRALTEPGQILHYRQETKA